VSSGSLREILHPMDDISEPALPSRGLRGGAVVEALRYKPEGRGFDSRWCHWNFSLT